MGVISLHNVILGGNDHVENEQDHPLVRADRGAGDVHCAVYCGEAADRGHGLPQRGKEYAESQQPGDETPVITGGDFTITAHTFENMYTQNRASGMTEAEAAPYTWTLTRDNYNTAGTWPELTQSTGTPG